MSKGRSLLIAETSCSEDMAAAFAMLVLLPLVLANWTHLGDNVQRFSDTAQVAETAVDQAAYREMVIGRYYMDKLNYTACHCRKLNPASK
jgi:hypothetical protein